MDSEYRQLNQQLESLIDKMQRIQASLAADCQPASLHEIDRLKQLGKNYAETVDKLAALENARKKMV